jgi:quinol monooxygenase YgiN
MNTRLPEERLLFNAVMLFASEQDSKAASGLLQASMGITLSKTGCIDCRLEQDESEPLRVGYNEQWETEAQFRMHAGSREFKHVLTAIDMCCETPEVKIGKLTTKSGVDSLREIYFDGIGIPQEGEHEEYEN